MTTITETAIKEAFGNCFFKVPEFDAIKATIEEVYRNVAVRKDDRSAWGEGNRADCNGVVMTAPTRSGKSALAQQVVNGLPDLVTTDGVAVEPASFYYECPSNFTTRLMLNGLVRGVQGGETTKRPLTADAARMRLDEGLPVFKPNIAIIDEFQFAFHPQVSHSRLPDAILANVGIARSLLHHPAWPLPIILIGTPELLSCLDRAEYRFLLEKLLPVSLAPMKRGDAAEVKLLRSALGDYCKSAHVNNGIADDNFYQRLIHASDHTRGLALELAQASVLHAWRNGRQAVTENDFAQRYQISTRAIDAHNPFIVPQWWETDRSRLLRSDEEARRTILSRSIAA